MLASMLLKASEWLATMRDKHLAVSVEYHTKDGAVYPVKATIGKTEFSAPDTYGVIVKMEFKDFLISIQNFKHVPELGDSIVYDGAIYEVLAPESRCVWRWSDQYRSTRRIHTKYLQEVTP